MATKSNRIAEHRKAARLSQEALAERLGCHWTTLSKLERGRIRLSEPWMRSIGKVLGVSPAELMNGVSVPPQASQQSFASIAAMLTHYRQNPPGPEVLARDVITEMERAVAAENARRMARATPAPGSTVSIMDERGWHERIFDVPVKQ